MEGSSIYEVLLSILHEEMLFPLLFYNVLLRSSFIDGRDPCR